MRDNNMTTLKNQLASEEAESINQRRRAAAAEIERLEKERMSGNRLEEKEKILAELLPLRRRLQELQSQHDRLVTHRS